MPTFFQSPVKASCCAVLTGFATLFIVPSVNASTIFYAVKNDGGTAKIFSVDPTNASSSIVNNTGLTASTVATGQGLNAFAYDPSANGVFFINSSSASNRELYFGSVNGITNSATLLGNLNSVTNGANTANLYSASFYNNSFYSIVNNSGTNPALVRVPIIYTGGLPTGIGVPIVSSVTNLPSLPYGDIAIDPNSGYLYGVSSNPNSGVFSGQSVTYKIDLGTNVYSQIAAQGSLNSVPGLQLAFNSSNNVLYGVDSAGNWVTVNTSNGARTSVAPGFSTAGLNDLAGGGPAAPVPAPLPILGAGIAFSTSRKLRKRIAVASVKS